MPERRGPPRPLGTLLDQLLKSWGLDRLSREREVFARWAEALGEPLARQIRPVAIHHGCLVIGVRDSVWMQELQFMKSDLKKKLNRVLGRGVIQEIRFKIGAWDQEQTPEDPGPAAAPELDPADAAYAEVVTRTIKDPILREQVKRALLAIARRQTAQP